MNREKITEDEYYEISRKDKLPKRCPILHKCERRLWTLYFFNDFLDEEYLRKMGKISPEEKEIKIIEILKNKSLISQSYEIEKIEIRGKPNQVTKGENGVGFSEMCPEVSLFEKHQYQYDMPRISAIGGRFSHNAEDEAGYYCGHFSECPEFSFYHYHYDRRNQNRKQTKNRVGISKKLRFEIYQRDNFTCQYCGRTKDDKIKLELDHKIPVSQGGKTDFNNLITSCYDCNRGKSNKAI